MAPTTEAITHDHTRAARVSSERAWLAAAPRRSSLSSARLLRARSNFAAPSPIERSIASRRASGVSSRSVWNTSPEVLTHSFHAASKPGQSFRSASPAGMAMYAFHRSATFVTLSAWTLTCASASGVPSLAEHQAPLGHQRPLHVPVRLEQVINRREALRRGDLECPARTGKGPQACPADESGDQRQASAGADELRSDGEAHGPDAATSS